MIEIDEKQVQKIAEILAKKIEKLITAGITDKVILTVEIKYALKEYLKEDFEK